MARRRGTQAAARRVRAQSKRAAARRAGEQSKRADRYDLYQRAVQEPEADIPLIQRAFRAQFSRAARTLREDFCGTALLACRWVEKGSDQRAWAIDLDPEPLEWGRIHNVAKLRAQQAARLKLIEGDVLDIGHERVDVTVAFNFSYFLFRERASLLHYFERAYATLNPQGALLLDVYGGADSQRTGEESRKVNARFDYIWDQNRFDPISHHVTNFIHFAFPDGSRMNRAFRYDWRLWSVPEIRELLQEAGFAKTVVYWEGTDRRTGRGNDVFSPRERASDDPAWICYIAAYRY
ncbi:MAG TPA: class I SAM-dependent methyltransferase [Myxococcota bacterium]|nr:class I SAM-dependent methyltransferase [Myxococcota bacterium]